MCLKHVHFCSSLSEALIVNLWFSFDYRFDYRLFVHQFGLKASHGIQDHLSRVIAFFLLLPLFSSVFLFLFWGGHIVFHAFLRCHRHFGHLITKFNYIRVF